MRFLFGGKTRKLISLPEINIGGDKRTVAVPVSLLCPRYDENYRMPDPGYPRNIRNWRGVPSAIDGVMTWTDGLTYFFKDGKFWRFNDYLVITENELPRSSARVWFGC